MDSSVPREFASGQFVDQAMASLEALADKDWNLAGRQMMALYSIASDQSMHDVCDGIELWIAHKGLTMELVQHLEQLIATEADADLKRRYRAWLDLYGGDEASASGLGIH